ncbi:MAG: lactate racemase domain-containing protein [Eubacteriales bacterium]|nr:lactate racemase domain-containing protein [Eubacteriales bacterium]
MKSVVSGLLADVPVPKVVRVRQHFPDEHIPRDELPAVILSKLAEKEVGTLIRPGMRIAITAGSRGISNIPLILKTLVEYVRSCEAEPFLAAAMGSHGGATSEGQRTILTGLGITEESVGCPILSNMDVVPVGRNAEGVQVCISRDAAEADGIIVCNRIKPHTCFRGDCESGLMKMMAVGLGKQIGADYCHKEGFQNMAKNIRLFGETVLHGAPVLFGVGVLENAFDHTAEVAVLHREEIPEEEPKLLKKAMALLPGIHVPECDVLVVDTIGKNFSGGGMDSNITGTFVTPYASGGLKSQRVAVLDLSDESHHNGTGCGMAHATTRRFFEKMDFEQTYPNVITSTVIENVRIPMVLRNDREAIQVCLRTCTGVGPEGPRLVRISNSMEIGQIYLSHHYLSQIRDHPYLQQETDLMDLPFDEEGNLTDLGRIGAL